MTVTNPSRASFIYQPEYELGIASNDVLVKNSSGRLIARIEAKEVAGFINMPKGELPASLRLVDNWKLCFSVVLMDEFGVSI